MPKKPSLAPDLFADLPIEPSQETPADVPAVPEKAVEPVPAPVQEPVESVQPACDAPEVVQTESLDEEPAEDDNGLPPVLTDGMSPSNNGELTLARYAAQAYLEYALSVVKSRALPDVFDGMKPVQRRILYAMDRMRLQPTAKTVKCARVVGDVLGKYHPHGDQAAYDAMVRLAQDFSLRYPLVDGVGNFGSRDGDSPAAMRYTEARLTKISTLLLNELDSGDVDFVPNYDGAFKEPTQLPARLPFVLLNGASGIAVGMATEIPSHNLNEVGQAVLMLLENPAASLDDVLTVLPAPDFPGGAQIISSKSDIRAIYESGRGSLKMRARYHFEDLQRGQWQLVIDELPPAASTESVLTQIGDLTNPKPKAGKKTLTAEQQQHKAAILALLDGQRDESDRETPVRIVFEPKNSRIDRDVFVNTLLAYTSLESNAPVNLVMLGIDGRPRQKTLLEILNEWISARATAVRRRTQVRLEKVNARLHILQGRTIAIDNIDRVIEIVRFDPDPKTALMAEFALSEQQAEDILDLRLRQLANLAMEQVRDEMAKLEHEKASLERILGSDKLLRGVIAREVREAMKEFGDARRTLVEPAARAVIEAVTQTEPVTVVISQKGFVRARTGHGHDATLMSYKMGDALHTAIECSSDDTLIAVGSNGRVYSVAVSQLPSARGDGLPLGSFIEMDAGTDLIGYVAGPAKTRVVLANDAGFGLACTIGDMTARVKSGKQFMNLPDDKAKIFEPQVVRANDTRLACLSAEGRLLVFELAQLRVLSGGGKGVTLMDLNIGEKLLSVRPVGDDGAVVTGKGRSTTREKTLTRGDWQHHFGQRARKGKALEIRFKALDVVRLQKDEQGNAVTSEFEEEAEPKIL